jgi:hypothetical protein
MLNSRTSSFAQAVANATIHGEITDVSGAAVPGAHLKATQTATGQVISTASGPDGAYVLPNLPIGPYKLEVSAPSFSTYLQSGISLQVGNNVQINVSLQVGAVSQEVQVSANAAMVETQDTAIAEVVDQQRIVELPLNGRQATDLILLSGGANVPPGAGGRFITTHDYVSSVGVSISGGQENGNNYLLDGGDHNDTHSNVNLPFPFPDALQEFSVQTNGVSARTASVCSGKCSDQVRHQPDPRRPVRICAQRCVQCPQLLCSHAGYIAAQSVRRHDRWSNQERQDLSV